MNAGAVIKNTRVALATVLYLITFVLIFSLLYQLMELLLLFLHTTWFYSLLVSIPVAGALIDAVAGCGLGLLALFIAHLPGLLLTDKLNGHDKTGMERTVLVTAIALLALYGGWLIWLALTGLSVPTGAWLYPLIGGVGLLMYRFTHFN